MIGNSVKIRKSDLETIFLMFYFAISPISKMLEVIWIPRFVTYIAMLSAMAVYIINRFRYLKQKLDVFISFLVLTIITLIGVLAHHSDFNSANEMYAMVIVFFPAYFIVRAANFDKLIRALHIYAYIGIVYCLPNAFSVGNVSHDYLAFAYDLLLPLCIIIYYAKKYKKWYDIVLSITGTIILVVFGSRGALIALGLYYLFVSFENGHMRKILILSTIIALIYLLYSNIEFIVTGLQKIGISSYLLNRIAKNEAFKSTSRTRLYEYIISELLPNNFFGVGPLGNRTLMPVIGYKIPYPHQLFLELMIDYGLILGGGMSISIIVIVLYLVFKSKDKYRYLTGLFCVASLFPLMLSGTFYTVGTVPYIFALFAKFREENTIYNMTPISGH